MVAKKSIASYEDLNPALGPFEADEPATQEEQDALDDVSAEILKFIHGNNSRSVLGSIANTPELYQGVGNAAFQILLAIKQQYERDGGKLPEAVLFGEGGAIHTAVDEIIQLAQAAGIQGSDDPNQYSAAMMEVMRLTGEYIETTGDDNSVAEAQELLIDVEETGYAGQQIPQQGDDESLRGAIQRSLDAQNQALQPQPAQDAANMAQAAPQQQSAEPQAGGLPAAMGPQGV